MRASVSRLVSCCSLRGVFSGTSVKSKSATLSPSESAASIAATAFDASGRASALGVMLPKLSTLGRPRLDSVDAFSGFAAIGSVVPAGDGSTDVKGDVMSERSPFTTEELCVVGD